MCTVVGGCTGSLTCVVGKYHDRLYWRLGSEFSCMICVKVVPHRWFVLIICYYGVLSRCHLCYINGHHPVALIFGVRHKYDRKERFLVSLEGIVNALLTVQCAQIKRQGMACTCRNIRAYTKTTLSFLLHDSKEPGWLTSLPSRARYSP